MTDTAPTGPISFEEFQTLLAEQLQVDRTLVTPEASFVHDLRVDSILLVEMMLSLDEQGIRFPMEAAWEIDTVGDAYRLYAAGLTQ
jgi:acyl carrier protein